MLKSVGGLCGWHAALPRRAAPPAWLRAHASTVRSTEVIQSQRDEIERLRIAGALRERRLAQTEALADLHRFSKDRPRFLEAVEALLEAKSKGKLIFREHIVEGIENFPEAFEMLFSGAKHGKLLIKVR